MIKPLVYSMTGYATRAVASLDNEIAEDATFTLTLKSVNHRFLDLQLRLPQSCESLEAPIRKLLRERIHRGHVDFSLQIDRQLRSGLTLNHEQIATYIASFRDAATAHNLATEPDLNEVLRIPGMISRQQTVTSEESASLYTAVIAEVPNLIASFNTARAAEGEILAVELRASMSRIDALAAAVSALREGTRAATFDRLRTRILELTSSTPTDDRLLAEAALLAERSDIDEEIVRLRAHTGAFATLLDQGGPLGKRLDFLLQELNREANTLLSKTGGASSQNGLRITDLGLEIKVEIERAREQIQNLE